MLLKYPLMHEFLVRTQFHTKQMRVESGREGLKSEKTASEVHRPGEEAAAWPSAPRAARARVQVLAADSPETENRGLDRGRSWRPRLLTSESAGSGAASHGPSAGLTGTRRLPRVGIVRRLGGEREGQTARGRCCRAAEPELSR